MRPPTYEDENARLHSGEVGARTPEDGEIRPFEELAGPQGDEPGPSASANLNPRPRGRPRRPTPRIAEVERVMRRDFDVIIEGSKQRLPLGEAIMMQLAHRALRGEIWAVNNLIKLMSDAEKTRAAQDATRAKREVERARNNARIRERQAAARDKAREAEQAGRCAKPGS